MDDLSKKPSILYNQEQYSFIQSKLENSCLLGIPGGGKTASIIGKNHISSCAR